jgi:predicted small lipoprotein YifL
MAPGFESILRRCGAILALLIALAGCGKKGPLYMPGEAPPPPPPSQSAPAG